MHLQSYLLNGKKSVSSSGFLCKETCDSTKNKVWKPERPENREVLTWAKRNTEVFKSKTQTGLSTEQLWSLIPQRTADLKHLTGPNKLYPAENRPDVHLVHRWLHLLGTFTVRTWIRRIRIPHLCWTKWTEKTKMQPDCCQQQVQNLSSVRQTQHSLYVWRLLTCL